MVKHRVSDPTLTPKQKKLLDFIEKFRDTNGYFPSQQEIANHFGFRSLGTVQNYLVRLERQGVLKKTWNAKRSMTLIPPQPHSETVPLPLVGRVAAGLPIEAIETPETLDVPPSMLKKGEHYVLQVEGDSMIEDGILNGDYVVIKKQNRADNGQTVVALISGEATIKRFYQKNSEIELHPANPKYKPILVNSLVDHPSDFRIEGVLVGVIRQLD